jgi:hypothetical protein
MGNCSERSSSFLTAHSLFDQPNDRHQNAAAVLPTVPKSYCFNAAPATLPPTPPAMSWIIRAPQPPKPTNAGLGGFGSTIPPHMSSFFSLVPLHSKAGCETHPILKLTGSFRVGNQLEIAKPLLTRLVGQLLGGTSVCALGRRHAGRPSHSHTPGLTASAGSVSHRRDCRFRFEGRISLR